MRPMGFTAKWLIPPFLLFIIVATQMPQHGKPTWQTAVGGVALIWFFTGLRACRLYWRSRFRARGARDGWAKR